jgi:hypothetical protein
VEKSRIGRSFAVKALHIRELVPQSGETKSIPCRRQVSQGDLQRFRDN